MLLIILYHYCSLFYDHTRIIKLSACERQCAMVNGYWKTVADVDSETLPPLIKNSSLQKLVAGLHSYHIQDGLYYISDWTLPSKR